jgi:hypothetical protein
MQTEEKLEWASEKVDKILNKSRSQNSKNGKKKTQSDSIKRIKDYFPIVPKSNQKIEGVNGDVLKGQAGVTQDSTPDKTNIENCKNETTPPDSGKLVWSRYHHVIVENNMDICGVHHCCNPIIGAKALINLI